MIRLSMIIFSLILTGCFGPAAVRDLSKEYEKVCFDKEEKTKLKATRAVKLHNIKKIARNNKLHNKDCP